LHSFPTRRSSDLSRRDVSLVVPLRKLAGACDEARGRPLHRSVAENDAVDLTIGCEVVADKIKKMQARPLLLVSQHDRHFARPAGSLESRLELGQGGRDAD